MFIFQKAKQEILSKGEKKKKRDAGGSHILFSAQATMQIGEQIYICQQVTLGTSLSYSGLSFPGYTL